MSAAKHKALYKRSQEKSHPWKDTYRRKCFDRLRASRSRLIDQFRNVSDGETGLSPKKMVQDVMEIEWNALKSIQGFPSLNNSIGNLHSFSNDDFDEESMHEIFAEIENELATEDERLLNELCQHYNAELNAQISMREQDNTFCPICQVSCLKESMESVLPTYCNVITSPVTPKSPLAFERKLIVKCDGCGLVLEGKEVTLSLVKSNLQHTLSNHEQRCSSSLSFAATSDGQSTNVLSSCDDCDWMSFLI